MDGRGGPPCGQWRPAWESSFNSQTEFAARTAIGNCPSTTIELRRGGRSPLGGHDAGTAESTHGTRMVRRDRRAQPISPTTSLGSSALSVHGEQSQQAKYLQ